MARLTRRCSRPAAGHALQLATQTRAAGLLSGSLVRQMRMSRRNRVVVILGLLVLGSSSISGASDHMTPKEECEALMSVLVPFAQQMLSKHREFYPFGGTMSVEGKIVQTASSTGEAHPALAAAGRSAREGISGWGEATPVQSDRDSHRRPTVPPGKIEKQDALEVRLDHVSGYSVMVVFPYAFSLKGDLEFSAPFAAPGDGRIFGH